MSALDQLPAFSVGARTMLGDEVYFALQQSILDGTVPPDARINAGELARRFDVSPTPVREALARLESDGLVEKLPLRGYRTTDLLDRQQLGELFELRLLLEPETAASAAARRSAAEAEGLEQEVEAGRIAIDEDDAYRLLSQHDVRLHDLVFRAAHNETVRQAYSRTHCHLHTFRLAYTGSYVADTVAEHSAVVAAIIAGDTKKASTSMRTHIERSRDRLMSGLD
ncbi:GntR family transcriptional regulator [Microbacterium sp. LWO13-1.2]|uniref:GntR family transcriptional regulator n=1 Tax=Microbacterium sp. LWO13-1.2 TaxID=3135262 RepID=UPI00313891EC